MKVLLNAIVPLKEIRTSGTWDVNIYIASSKGVWEFKTVTYNFREFSQTHKCLDEAI